MLNFKKVLSEFPIVLAPMADYTHLPFRICLRSLGGFSLATTELINARSLLELNPKAIRMMSTCPEDHPLGIQLFGGNSDEMRAAAIFLQDIGADWIDINMGCPAPRVHRCGGGAALMKNEKLAEKIVADVVNVVKIPVTVKMRLGWNDSKLNAHILAPRFEKLGAAAITIHGRTCAQGYSGQANWDEIKRVADSIKKIPIIGNGDVRTPQDAAKMLREVGCAGVMIGRAVFKNPFLLSQADHFIKKGGELEPETLEEKIKFMNRHFEISVKLFGEELACRQFRKAIAGYSHFLLNRKEWLRPMRLLSSAEEYRNICKKMFSS